MIWLCLSLAVAGQLYKFPAYSSLQRLAGFSAVSFVEYESSLIVLGNSQGRAVVKSLTAEATLWSQTLTTSNNSTAVSISGIGSIQVAINVAFETEESLPFTSSDTPRTGQTHGLLVELEPSDGTVLTATWTGNCLGNSSSIAAMQASSSAYYVAGSCGSPFLQSQDWLIPLPGTPSSIAVTESDVYLTESVGSSMYLSRFSSSGSLQWRMPAGLPAVVPASLASYTNIFFTSEYFVLCAQSSVLVFTQSSQLLWSTQIPAAFQCSCVSLIAGQGFLIAGNLSSSLYSSETPSYPVFALIWFDFNGQQQAYRIYDVGAATDFVALAFNDQLSVLLNSVTTFYNDTSLLPTALVFSAEAPFELSECAETCSSCFGSSNLTCYSCTTYESSQFSCGVCPEECASCYSESACTACHPNYDLVNTTCVLDLHCPPAQYSDPTSMSCSYCNASCAKCSAPESCTACPAPYSLNDGQCLAQCPSYRYSDNSVCLDCDASCLTCDYGAGNCTSCYDQLFLFNGTCTQTCPEQTYVEEMECLPCDSSCRACSGPEPTACSSCQPGYFAFQSQCMTACPEGFYFKSNTCTSVPACPPKYFFNSTDCEQCSSECLSCFGPSALNCVACAGDLFLKNASCVEPVNCTYGQYRSESNTCSQCPCEACNSADNCSSCSNGTFLYEGACQATCPLMTYALSGACESCSAGCLTCDGAGCSHCLDGWFLNGTGCVQTCPDGMYGSEGKCIECPKGCVLCQNATVCRECDAQFFITNSACEPCQAPCYNCTAPGVCSSCGASSSLFNESCVDSCPRLYGAYQGECLPCPERCEECDQLNCTLCSLNVPSRARYLNVGGHCTNNLACSSWDGTVCGVERSSLQEFFYYLIAQL